MKHMYSTIKSLLLIATVALSSSAFGQSITINPSKDNTLYENSSGSLSNGSGDWLFIGRTAQGSNDKRRAVLEFDILGNLPTGAIVDSVVLKITVDKVSNTNTENCTLHSVDAEWGEGTSDAPGQEGSGTTSSSGDATWKHSSYSGTDWSSLGGDYNSTASANTSISNTGTYIFTSTAMKNDVQGWINNSSSNHGWIILGNESSGKTAKRLKSRESTTGKPELIIYYTCSKAAFTSSGSCINSPVNFTNTSTNAVSYRWDFDNNGTTDDTTKNPSHIFTTSGFKTVELVTYSSGGCKDSTTKSVLIFGLPNVSFTADTVCTGDSTTLTSDYIGLRYEWDFDADGLIDTILTSPTIKHLFTLSGLVDVRLRYTDNNGCENETLQKILIPIKPLANFKSDVVCGKSATTFQNQSATASSSNIFRWDFDGDGTTDTTTTNFAAVQYTFPSGGAKPVRLVIETDNGCLDTAIKNAMVDTIPLINLDVDTVCIGVATQINDLSTHVQAGGSYKWDFDNDGTTDNFSSGSKSITFPNNGNNPFKLIIENPNGCKDSIVDTAVITQGITVDFTADTVCIGAATNFTDKSTITSSVDYKWDFDNDGTVDDNTEGNNTYIYVTEGIYTAKLVISDASGCKDSTTIDVEVLELPDVKFTADTVCLGSATSFTDKSTVGFGPTYRWDYESDGIIDNGFPGNVMHTYTTGGERTAKLTVTSIFGCTDSTSVDVLVKVKPVASFTVTEDDPDVILTNNSTGDISSFEWDFGDGNTNSTDASLTYTYAANGGYTICLTTTNECGDSVVCDDVTITGISVSNIVLLDAFKVAPNPFANSINIISNDSYNYSVKVTDVQGRTIYNENKVNGNRKIDLSEYNKGIYFITISTEIGTITHKIVKSE